MRGGGEPADPPRGRRLEGPDSLWTLAGSWERRAGERAEEGSGEPVSRSRLGWGGRMCRPHHGGSGNGVSLVREGVHPPHGSLSPGVGLCVLLSVSECACGGAGVPWLATSLSPSPGPFLPSCSSSTSSVGLSPCQGPPRRSKSVLPGEGRVWRPRRGLRQAPEFPSRPLLENFPKVNPGLRLVRTYCWRRKGVNQRMAPPELTSGKEEKWVSRDLLLP